MTNRCLLIEYNVSITQCSPNSCDDTQISLMAKGKVDSECLHNMLQCLRVPEPRRYTLYNKSMCRDDCSHGLRSKMKGTIAMWHLFPRYTHTTWRSHSRTSFSNSKIWLTFTQSMHISTKDHKQVMNFSSVTSTKLNSTPPQPPIPSWPHPHTHIHPFFFLPH